MHNRATATTVAVVAAAIGAGSVSASAAPAGLPKAFGAKAALQSGAISCDFVSYWEGRDMSIIGPITIAKVSG